MYLLIHLITENTDFSTHMLKFLLNANKNNKKQTLPPCKTLFPSFTL